jgi:tetratricopeptide (TPR) repeat protein
VFVNHERALDELTQWANVAADEGFQNSIILITGTAGVGKTSLAVRWTHQSRDLFPDGQLYLNMRGFDAAEPIEPLDAIGRLLPALGVPANAVPDDLEAAAARFRTEIADRQMLILLDNVSAISQVRPLLPGNSSCMILITSRNSLAGLISRDGAKRINLELFTADTSVMLLKSLFTGLRTGDEDDGLAELATICARLPLALRVAAERAIERPYESLAEIIDSLRSESSLWESLSTDDSDQADSIRAVLSWSYRSLAQSAAQMFRLLGLHTGQEVSTGAAAALAGVPVTAARAQLDRLVNAHMIEAVARDRFQFHDLLRAYAVDQVSTEPEDERASAVTREVAWYTHSIAAVVAAVQRFFPAQALDPLPPGCELVGFKSRDAAVDWYEAERANVRSISDSAARYGLRRWAWQLAITLYPIYHATRGSYRDWLVIAEHGLSAARAERERVAVATLLNGRAVVHTEQTPRRLDEAARDLLEALAIWRDLGDLTGQARTTNSMGHVALRRRNLTEAADCFDQVHAFGQRLPAAPWTAIGLENAGIIHYELGQFRTAADLASQALAALEESAARNDSPIDPRLEFGMVNDLCRAQRKQGLLDQAATTADRAMQIATAQSGQGDFLMWALLERGRLEAAIGNATAALSTLLDVVRQARAAGDQVCEAHAIEAIGDAYQLAANNGQAQQFYVTAALGFEAVQEPWRSADVRAKLATCLAGAGNVAEALTERQAALGLIAEYDDPYVAMLRRQLTDEIEG